MFKICWLICSIVGIFNIVIFDVQYLFPGILTSTMLGPCHSQTKYGKKCRKTSKRKSNNLSPRIAIERGFEDQIPQHRNKSFYTISTVDVLNIIESENLTYPDLT
jgi:hypothetical protein